MSRRQESLRLIAEAEKLRQQLRKLEESDSAIDPIHSPAHEVAKSSIRERIQELGRQIKRLGHSLF